MSGQLELAGFDLENFLRDGILLGEARVRAIGLIEANHYTRSVPSGKSHYVGFREALVVWSIPANKNLAAFLLPGGGLVWELSRLWAPDGHQANLLSEAISYGVKIIKRLEHPELLVSYSDPQAGHSGGVYRAASWIHHGRSAEPRAYQDRAGNIIARRTFHSGKSFKTKAQIEALGYRELKLAAKHRFVKPLSKRAKKHYRNWPAPRPVEVEVVL